MEEDKVINFNSKRPFAIWTVGDVDYKLKLKTSHIRELEEKYKQNLMNLMGSNTGAGMPPISTMLDITYAAMKDYQHGMKSKDIEGIFDVYIDEGGSQLDFYMNVYMNIFTVSGFFSKDLAESMGEKLEEAKEKI